MRDSSTPSSHDPRDPRTWSPNTLVVRGGIRDVVALARRRSIRGAWSVVSEPELPLEVLAASVRNNNVRVTTVQQVLAAGGTLMPTRGPGRPPYHCDLTGLTPIEFDAILGPEMPNPCR